MNVQSRQMVVNALLKVVNAAPNSQIQTSYYYSVPNQPRPITNQDFITWLNYVNSTLDISYNHTGLNNFLSTKINISQISFQNNMPFEQRIDSIKREIINLAQEIIY